jgi:hypothetical protein
VIAGLRQRGRGLGVASWHCKEETWRQRCLGGMIGWVWVSFYA